MNATTVLSSHLSEEVRTKTLIKIGGYSALVVAALQVAGNALHPPIPPDTIEALGVIQRNQLWNPVHIEIAVSYFLFIPFVLGAAATFNERTPLVRIATPLVIVGAAIGGVQILSHLTVFRTLAIHHHAGGGEAAGSSTAFLYELLWP